MDTIAQTSIQLYNQLQRQQRTADELALVRRAYDLARSLYSAYFQADGVPFVAHVTGVASILAHLGLSIDYVAAACLHNVYTAGDFGDGLRRCATARRRQIVEDAVGREVEGHVYRFWTWLRAIPAAPIGSIEEADRLAPEDRQLLIMDLADMLEKCHDMGPLYYGDSEWIVGRVKRKGAELAELARHLGQPELATMLSSSIAALLTTTVPHSLRSADPRQKYARLQIPNSCIQRPDLVLRRKLRQMLHRIRRNRPLGQP